MNLDSQQGILQTTTAEVVVINDDKTISDEKNMAVIPAISKRYDNVLEYGACAPVFEYKQLNILRAIRDQLLDDKVTVQP